MKKRGDLQLTSLLEHAVPRVATPLLSKHLYDVIVRQKGAKARSIAVLLSGLQIMREHSTIW
jgi:hypothetical protein